MLFQPYMKQLCIKGTALALLMVMALSVGCSRSVPPPTPFTEQEMPGEIEKAFGTAKQPEAKDLASQFLAAIQAKDYSKAHYAIQALAGVQGISKEQIQVATRASLTVSSLLESARAQGDTKAAQTIKSYMETK